ncbi:hypothetical protein V8E53_008695 [Lactarius tabidus]
MPASPESLKVDVLMGMDPPKSPVMLLMVIPPSMNQVSINFHLKPEGNGTVAATTGTSMEAEVSQDGKKLSIRDRAKIPGAPQPVHGLKHSHETSRAQPVAKLPRMVSGRVQGSSKPSTAPKAGPSTVKVNQKPQYIPDSELVLPPVATRFVEELTTFPDDFNSSATEPETSEDEVRAQGGLAKE